MKRFIFHIHTFVLIVMAGLVSSCQDELTRELDYTSVGEDVTITIPITAPQMEVKSRANIADADRDGIKSLWIAVFDATTNQISSRPDPTKEETGWIKIESPTDDYIEAQNQAAKVTLNAKSGPSYIVAVANVDNIGVTSDNPTNEQTLRNLLTDNISWTDFNKIAVVNFPSGIGSESTEILLNAPDIQNGIPMSGCYSSLALGGTHPDDWSATNASEIFIPASTDGSTVDLTTGGVIHLRRLLSHITFNIQTAGNVVDLSVENYRIVNVPNHSWLYEQSSNFGDIANSSNVKTYYHDPVQFGAQYVNTTDVGLNEKNHKFDFWLMENKHEGTATDYDDRAVKSANSTSDNILYTALTGDTWTSNNMASHVIIRCNVTYKEKVNVDNNGLNVGTTSEVYRMGVAEYTVHLGYIGNNPNDFNSYRNTEYTYNLTVSGLNQIVVEANRTGLRNDAEGIITDVETRTVQLDAHYATFNVAFTEAELSDIENFGYIVTTYESGIAKSYTEANPVSSAERKYIDWIELKSTSNATLLASYKPASRGSYTAPDITGEDAPVMPIDEFYKKVKEIKENRQKLSDIFTQNADGKYYFTVFINEYTYEPRYGDDNWGLETTKNWHTYINQPSRHFFFRVKRQESLDGNSIYARSKYAIEQQSIQSYYTAAGSSSASTALGIEHTNEVQGLNLRRNFTDNGNHTDGQPLKSNINGRWNAERWITNKNTVSQPKWSSFVQLTESGQIPKASEFTGDRLQGGPQPVSIQSGWNPASEDQTNTGFYYLPALANYTGGTLNSSQYDPQPSSTTRAHYIEAINACMNRNRDENGDGNIDEEELKWYIPASGKYLRAILGRNSLPDPIMPYRDISKLPSTDNGQNSRWLLYASDDKVAWAMEGLSMGDWQDRSQGDRYPWNVRCVRNLGTDLRDVVREDKITMAYTHNANTRTVIMDHYDAASIRTEKITGKGNANNGAGMPVHPVTDPLNMVYYAFQYSQTYGLLSYTESVHYLQVPNRYVLTNATNPCYNLTEDGYNWRLPNQKELAIMRNLDLLEGMTLKDSRNIDIYALSCTYDFFTINAEGTSQGTPKYEYITVNGASTPNHRLMVSRADGGTRFPQTRNNASDDNTRNYYTVYYRCVRDVER